MARNLILCFDGTNNQFGPQNTNVVRLVQSLVRDSGQQRLYYDPGVGTMPEPGLWSKVGKRLSEIWGLAFGIGLTRKVEQAYCWLMETWEPGDRVFVFGFSRGAYTARVLSGLLHALGLLPPGGANMVPYAMKLYKAIRPQNDPRGGNIPPNAQRDKQIEDYWKLCDEFRQTFARPVTAGDNERRFPTHFMGVWDTVSSVGWVWDPASFQFTARNPSVAIARHAMATDERRAFFRQNRLLPATGQDLEQRWFPGVHSDVGGGYELRFSNPPPVYSRLWQRPFEWIIGEARQAGLLIDDQRLQAVLSTSPSTQNGWTDPQHESLTGAWRPAEWFPKFPYDSATKQRRMRINRGHCRTIQAGELLDQWTLRRVRDTEYTPANLSPRFCDSVRQLPADAIPETMPYAP